MDRLIGSQAQESANSNDKPPSFCFCPVDICRSVGSGILRETLFMADAQPPPGIRGKGPNDRQGGARQPKPRLACPMPTVQLSLLRTECRPNCRGGGLCRCYY
ncbi:hypothetical protein CSOJ01_09666 [Colletotrichum sojae]|uniref:Uncharacterized protein n=1 Tax=Colletotrichum sojae TaxID=2175907 RepID=A0A8H6J2Y3_9PEZI|nr:hypothetical protein CSOJ01_09666 [Colletotrichum sojae]